MTNERKHLIDDYFAHAFEIWRNGDRDRYCGAWETVYAMVRDHPDEAWTLVLEMIERAPNERMLAYIAADPLEDLIASHGCYVIDRVEDRALTDPKFRRALRGVWFPEGVDERVAARVLFLVKDEPPL